MGRYHSLKCAVNIYYTWNWHKFVYGGQLRFGAVRVNSMGHCLDAAMSGYLRAGATSLAKRLMELNMRSAGMPPPTFGSMTTPESPISLVN